MEGSWVKDKDVSDPVDAAVNAMDFNWILKQEGPTWGRLCHPFTNHLRRVLTQEHTRGFNLHTSNSKGCYITPPRGCL